MTTFFTSDTHFGHRNIIRYCKRPFDSVEAMDEALIENWNARVGDDDIVYHLADFTLGNRAQADAAFRRLRGHIRVLGLPWHHDKGWCPRVPGPSTFESASRRPVEILPALLVLKLHDGRQKRTLTLSHYPMAEWEKGHHGAWHLHGHSHGNHRGLGSRLDVGVDVHNYAPLALEELAGLMPPPKRFDGEVRDH